MTESKYAQAGVDFGKEHDVVGIFRALREATLPFTADLRKMGITFPEQEGDFSGGFQINTRLLSERGIEKIVSQQCVDGPGSKPVVHALYNGTDPIKQGCTAIDSIAMVVNDLVCSGARPVTLVEYHSWHDPNIEIARQLAQGNLIAAEISQATIIGGENASLSAMITGPIPSKAYDMCHVAYGIITDKDLIDNPLGKTRVQPGDVAIGITSSGLHCNGITLAWKTAIDFTNHGFTAAQKINERVDSLEQSIAEAVLTPTTIYTQSILQLLNRYGPRIRAVANITGEGVHNIRRVLPEKTGIEIYYPERSGNHHKIFDWIQRNAGVSDKEMYEDYNMGLGMVLIVDESFAQEIVEDLNFSGQTQKFQTFDAHQIGIVARDSKEIIAVRTPNEKGCIEYKEE